MATRIYQVYVWGINPSITRSDLEEAFRVFGNVVDVKMLDGYCFIGFDTREAMEKAIEKGHIHMRGGTLLRIKRSLKKRKFSVDNRDILKSEEVLNIIEDYLHYLGDGYKEKIQVLYKYYRTMYELP